MIDHKEIKLSSNWTNIGIYGGVLVVISTIPIVLLIVPKQEFHFGMVIGALIFLLLLGFVIYQLIYASDAKIIGGRLVLKKQFRVRQSYAFDKIGSISSFQLKSTKYITVEMKNDDKSVEKYLIINARSILAFENKDAEYALNSLRNIDAKE